MRAVRAAIDAVAPLDQAVLILGETGTGKEIAAGLIHAGGRRGAAPLIALNCAAIPESLAESELFGHRRGSFTGAEQDREGILSAAGDGDVFLDEIDSLSLRLQGLLLRVLETGDYRAVGDTTVRRCRARFITAANRDLGALIAEGRFRSDLYYRLQRFVVTIPPLRDRREDIPALAGYLIDRVAGDRRLSLDPRLVDLLVRHDWPGNVRELRNAVERMALLCGDRRILGPADCPELAPGWGRAAAVPPPAPPPAMPVPIPGQPRTRDRRARILALFATQPRLHRQDVVRELCTAATTATEDLRVLCALGLIRRIDTSGHACTSYFVKVGEGEDGASGHGAVRTK
jgi:transcriptional regulator with PAS, ATPase and Fis domain